MKRISQFLILMCMAVFSGNAQEKKAFTLEDVIELGTEKLVRKAKEAGARDEDIVVEVADSQVFNVVRGYSTIGKNMRVRLQVKPGLIKDESN